MYATNYHRASSVADAVKLQSSSGEAKYLSGGMTLIPTMKQRLAAPPELVDLRHVAEMKGISVSGNRVRIGAGTTHHEVSTSAELKAVCPAICHLAALIGDPHVRHMGTIGGSIANNDPAADYPSAMLGLNATIITNAREIPADDFFLGLFETALEDSELVVAVTFDAPAKAGYSKFANPASRFAMTGVFVAKAADGGVRVAVTGAGSNGVFRHAGLEKALATNWSADAASGVTVDASDLLADIHGSAEYRANLVKVMAKRAVAAT
ncbi:MAG: xanthine dehydrogenase family protein subunit M [Shinella sp.]|uniref:FAD binding domain-containing protein n=1 Tax=Shinella sp. TaxID=1870904 RepID=UPI003C76AE2A